MGSDALRQKIDKKAENFHFIGCCKSSKGYRLFNEKSKKVVVRRDVPFDEADFGYRADGESAKIKEVMEIDAEVDANTPEKISVAEPRCSERISSHMPIIRYGIDEYCDTAAVEGEVSYAAY